jgi:Ala-tRNA(Pro) deacylase
MPAQKLKEFLDRNGVKYVTIRHSPAFTAQEIAASAHVSGNELAKTVMVKLDGRMAMVVVRATDHVDFERLRQVSGAKSAGLASEEDFKDMFPGCEVGAMPPFGNLYDLEVYASKTLAEDEQIAFNAGSHTELFKMSYADFDRLAKPKVAKVSV